MRPRLDSRGKVRRKLCNPFHPDALVVVATLGISTCEDPFALELVCSTWRLSFNLPPDLQFVGASAALADMHGTLTASERNEEGDCFGGATVEGLSGQVLITAIDDTRVTARVTETVDAPFGSGLDIDAVRCD
jgi:hypothetical protein